MECPGSFSCTRAANTGNRTESEESEEYIPGSNSTSTALLPPWSSGSCNSSRISHIRHGRFLSAARSCIPTRLPVLQTSQTGSHRGMYSTILRSCRPYSYGTPSRDRPSVRIRRSDSPESLRNSAHIRMRFVPVAGIYSLLPDQTGTFHTRGRYCFRTKNRSLSRWRTGSPQTAISRDYS